jgi:hypothetical protein
MIIVYLKEFRFNNPFYFLVNIFVESRIFLCKYGTEKVLENLSLLNARLNNNTKALGNMLIG